MPDGHSRLPAAYRHILDTSIAVGALTIRAAEFLAEQGAWQELGFESVEAMKDAVSNGIRQKLPASLRRPVALQLAADGMTQREIAIALGVSQKTVSVDLNPPDTEVSTEVNSDAQDADETDTSVSPKPADRGEPDADHEFRRQQLPTIIAGNIAGLKVLAEFTLREISGTIPQAKRKGLARRLRRVAQNAIRVADYMEKNG